MACIKNAVSQSWSSVALCYTQTDFLISILSTWNLERMWEPPSAGVSLLAGSWNVDTGWRRAARARIQPSEDSKEHSTLSVSLGFEKTTDRWLYLGILTDNATFPEAKEQAGLHVSQEIIRTSPAACPPKMVPWSFLKLPSTSIV